MQVEVQWRGFECMPSPTAEVGVAAHIAEVFTRRRIYYKTRHLRPAHGVACFFFLPGVALPARCARRGALAFASQARSVGRLALGSGIRPEASLAPSLRRTHAERREDRLW